MAKTKTKKPKTYPFVRKNTFQEYLKGKIRISGEARDLLIREINGKLDAVLREAHAGAEAADYKTIMLNHMTDAMERELVRKRLEPHEVLSALVEMDSAQVGELVRLIKAHMEKRP